MTENSPEPSVLEKQFSALKTFEDLARLLRTNPKHLKIILFFPSAERKYHQFLIPKKMGGVRAINAPNEKLKEIQKSLHDVLCKIYKPRITVRGFIPGVSIVENAIPHVASKFLLNLDLQNFFPSINFGRVRGMFLNKPYCLPANISTLLARICCFNNALPQGAPTSPIIANMICARLDSEIQRFASKHKLLYTRYADDITLSTRLPNLPRALAVSAAASSSGELAVSDELHGIIHSNGFEVNKGKTRLQSQYIRQVVTGLTVNQFPNVKRKFIKQVRGMLHAWGSFGLENSEKVHLLKHYVKHRSPDKKSPSFLRILRGKIEFIGMVRGKNNQIYRKLLARYHAIKEGKPIDLKRIGDDLPALSVLRKDLNRHYQAVNKIYEAKHGEPLFKPTTQTAPNWAVMNEPCKAEDDFEKFIPACYKIFYEGSGGLKRMPQETIDNKDSVFFVIKHLRTDRQHDVEHGDLKEIQKKKEIIMKIYKNYLGVSTFEQISADLFDAFQRMILRNFVEELKNLIPLLEQPDLPVSETNVNRKPSVGKG